MLLHTGNETGEFMGSNSDGTTKTANNKICSSGDYTIIPLVLPEKYSMRMRLTSITDAVQLFFFALAPI